MTWLLHFSPVHRWALNAVSQSKEDECFRETKFPFGGSQRVSDYVLEAQDTSLASEFVNLNKVYRFRLGGESNITQTAGVINTFFACDPSSGGTNFPEWSTLSALFSEFRLVEYGIELITDWQTSNNSTIGTTALGVPAVLCAGNLGTAVAPGSYTAVADNADSCWYQASRDTSTRGFRHAIDGRGVGWSQVTTPTVTPYAGAPGCIQIYGAFGASNQSSALRALVWGIYDFRSRV